MSEASMFHPRAVTLKFPAPIVTPNAVPSSVENHDAEQEVGVRTAVPTITPRYSRRLSDKILIAFHGACDQADFDVADQLLRVLEMMLTRRTVTPDGSRRRSMESLVAAHERLWHLRHAPDNHG